MTIKEFGVLVDVLKTFYPKENLFPTEEAVTLWYGFLKDLDYPVVSSVIQKWVSTNKWSPSIAEIREQAVMVEYGNVLSWGEAWQTVVDAIHHYGHYQIDKALASLDPITLKAVNCLDFERLCASTNQDVDRANFRMIYDELVKREMEDAQTPPAVRERIASLTKSISEKLAPGIEEKHG